MLVVSVTGAYVDPETAILVETLVLLEPMLV